MDLSLRELTYLAILVGVLLAIQRLKGFLPLFSLLVLPGTFCHELCHLVVGGILRGQPTNFTVIPRREGRGWVMGSVTFANIRWYNAFFLGMAPLLLLPAAMGLLAWRFRGNPGFNWPEGLTLYLIANLIYASLPSWQDFRIAARSPIGWLLLAAVMAYGWHLFRNRAIPPVALNQLEIAGLTGFHPPSGNPGTDIGLGEPHEIR